MPLRTKTQWWGTVLDSDDPRGLAHFYADLLGWQVFSEDEGGAAVSPSKDAGYNIATQLEPNYVRPVWPSVEGEPLMMLHLDIEVDDLAEAVATRLASAQSCRTSNHRTTCGSCSIRRATRSACTPTAASRTTKTRQRAPSQRATRAL